MTFLNSLLTLHGVAYAMPFLFIVNAILFHIKEVNLDGKITLQPTGKRRLSLHSQVRFLRNKTLKQFEEYMGVLLLSFTSVYLSFSILHGF